MARLTIVKGKQGVGKTLLVNAIFCKSNNNPVVLEEFYINQIERYAELYDDIIITFNMGLEDKVLSEAIEIAKKLKYDVQIITIENLE